MGAGEVALTQWGRSDRMLQNKEHNLHLSPNITGIMKSGRIKWTGQVACILGNGYMQQDWQKT